MSTPRTVLPDARVLPRFAGVSTFCRVPLIEAVPAAGQPVDWALYGVPFDGGVTYRVLFQFSADVKVGDRSEDTGTVDGMDCAEEPRIGTVDWSPC